MKLKTSEVTAGPAHLASRIKTLDADVEKYPLGANPPESVSAAHAAYLAAVSSAKQIAAQFETVEQAAHEASTADVAAAVKVAEAGGAGKLPEPTRSRKAAGAVEAAMFGCAVAEKHVEKAHANLVAAVRDSWPEWRREDVASAEQAHQDLEAALAAALDAARVVVASRAAVLRLDSEVLARDKALHVQVSGERRPNAVAWYAETHHNYRVFDGVVQALDDLAKQAAASHEFAAADWLPPSDPDHGELLATPVDAGSDWLHRMAQRETGKTCSVCAVAPAAVPVVIEGQWWTVCPACAEANATEHNAILAERQRQAEVAEHGVDPHIVYSVGEDGSHDPA